MGTEMLQLIGLVVGLMVVSGLLGFMYGAGLLAPRENGSNPPPPEGCF